MQLKGRVALVTGAAHRLGKAIAKALAEQGCHLAVHYGRSEQAAVQTVDEMSALGIEAVAVSVDLSQESEIEDLFSRLETHFGKLDILVNSAASFERQSFGSVSAGDWDRVMAVNLRAPFLCTRHAARLILEGRRDGESPGLVVNMVDLSATSVWPGYVQHGVSKAGLLQLTRIAARELAPGVRVNAIQPGAVLPPPGMESESEQWRRMGERLPVGRTGDPSQVGQTVVFLAQNDFITGEVIIVDGGEHLLGAGHRRPVEES
jgi:NAD(P)-dependent dehydrogenase (short-subunit alcohol dehydrogenase family)